MRYDITDFEERQDGTPMAVRDFQSAPSHCKRCGCPMDPSKSQEFADKMAEKEAGLYGPGVGQVVTVPKAKRRGVSVAEETDDNDSEEE